MAGMRFRKNWGFDDGCRNNGGITMDEPGVAGFMPRLRQWLLRLLVDHAVVMNDRFDHDRFLAGTGAMFPMLAKADQGKWHGLLQAERERMGTHPAPVQGPLAANIEILAKALRMSDIEADVLALTLLCRTFEPLEQLLDLAMPRTDSGRLSWQLSRVLGYHQPDVDEVLSASGVLISAGLIRVDAHCTGAPLPMVVELNRRLMRLLTRGQFGVDDLLGHAARRAGSSSLRLEDFDHLGRKRDLVLRYLEAVASKGLGKANLLFDGPPGVGKTELARLVGQHLGYEVHEINEFDDDGDPAMPGERVQFLRMALRMLERGDRPLIIFDEADAVMSGNLDDHRRALRGSKAGMIRMLEELEVPVIWITNHGGMIDPAVARRVDLTIRFEAPPPAVREAMLRASLPPAARDQAWLSTLSKKRSVTPARIEQARRVADLIAGEDSDSQAELFRNVLEENLGLCLQPKKRKSGSSFELPYRLDAVHADEDLDSLVQSMHRHRQGRICLYGPPGTGKTRFVKHLAESCGLKLAEHRASDLLGKYVGESEQNIRRMFEECDDGQTLLFLDEADSLISSREAAQHQWQIGQINELLKGLEGFEGVFVASTNLMGKLDSAVMRRLDFKVHFQWLQADQRWRLFLDLASHVGLTIRGANASRLRQRVDRLHYLTPGDFAMLARRLTLRPTLKNGAELAEMLEKEMWLKPEAKATVSIGFTASLARE